MSSHRLGGSPSAPNLSAEDFWAANQPGFRSTSAEIGTPRFFEEVERQRYRLEPHIPAIVRFERWAGYDVLDAGCGIATDGLQFARAGARFTGMDGESAAVELARRRFELAGVSGSFFEGSVTDLPFEDSSFDLVYSHGVIHHVVETERALEEFYRVLRPGGSVLVMVYHRGSLNYYINIMTLRRVLALLLMVRGVTGIVARLTSERQTVLDGHRQLLKRHGLRYLTDHELFLSNNTDGPGNPLSKVYSRSDVRRLFGRFEDVQVRSRFLNLRIYPGGTRIAQTRPARWLEQFLGWHLYIEGRKPGPPLSSI
jgi:ubiquinone/menaquinone biosynthesis C-methylase UbiE